MVKNLNNLKCGDKLIYIGPPEYYKNAECTFCKYDEDGDIFIEEVAKANFRKYFKLKEGNKMKEFFGDMFGGAREFVKEHRNILYTVAFIALVDHFFLGGELRGRLKSLVAKLLDSVTSKVEKIGQ